MRDTIIPLVCFGWLLIAISWVVFLIARSDKAIITASTTCEVLIITYKLPNKVEIQCVDALEKILN